MNGKVMYKLSYGLFVLTAAEGGKDNGCIINTAVQLTTTPNRISIAVNKSNYTHDMILRTSRFSISILNQEANFDLFKHFGFQTGKEVDKFAGYENCKRAADGTMIVTEGTNGFISASVISAIDVGTHTLFLADVTDGEIFNDVPSATYEYYQNHIKAKPAAAPKADTGEVIWRCTVCGYEYKGADLPADFICPWCKHPASDFEKAVVG